jgi:hypothetical protein
MLDTSILSCKRVRRKADDQLLRDQFPIWRAHVEQFHLIDLPADLSAIRCRHDQIALVTKILRPSGSSGVRHQSNNSNGGLDTDDIDRASAESQCHPESGAYLQMSPKG